MSKRIAFVPDIQAEHASGDPLYRLPNSDRGTTLCCLTVLAPDGKNSKDEKLEPYMLRQYAFMLERTTDGACVKHIENKVEAELFRSELRTILKKQKTLAAERGYWEFEDEHAQALMNATTTPETPYNIESAFNFVPFIRAVKNMTTPLAEIELPADAPANVSAAS